ncbi:MAG: methyl-accepting chemotaxis protein [Candidatus Woesearchaeota archaeon]
MRISDVRISVKLLLGFMIMAVIVLAVGLMGYAGIEDVAEDLDYIGNDRLDQAVLLGTMNTERMIIRAQTLDVWTYENVPDSRDKYEDILNQRAVSFSIMESSLEELLSFEPSSKREEELRDDLVKYYDEWRAIYVPLDSVVERLAKTTDEVKKEELYEEYKGAMDAMIIKSDAMGSTFVELLEYNLDFTHESVDRDLELAHGLERTMIVVVIIGLILSVVLALFITKIITRPINKGVGFAKIIASGDLTTRLDIDQKDEIGQLAEALNKMKDNLANLIGELKLSADTSASTAEELSASAQEVNASSEQVSSTIQEIAKGGQGLTKTASGVKVDIEEVGKAAKIVEEKSKKAAENAADADKAADLGAQAGKRAGDVMRQILESSKESAEDISQLDAKSKEIGKIIEVINGISEQTNLLALNAAIEAARAGDAGRGFAVVADEVRKLAEESQKATTRIETMIKNIQEGTTKSVEKMNMSTSLVNEGSVVVNEALKSLEDIGRLAKDIGAQSQEVSAAATQASGGVDKVSKAISEVSAIAEENAAGTEEVSASMEETTSSMTQVSDSAQELAKGADKLKQLVSKFKLDSST